MDSIQNECDYITKFFKDFFYLYFSFDDSNNSNCSLDDLKEMIEESNNLKVIYPIVIKFYRFFYCK